MSALCILIVLVLLILSYGYQDIKMGCFCVEIINSTCMQMTCTGEGRISNCFPAHSQMLLANGSEVYINKLVYGDKLASNSSSHSNLFQFYWHEQAEAYPFVEYLRFSLVATNDNYSFLEITPQHRLFSISAHTPRMASEFRVGDTLWGRFGPVKIKTIHSVFYNSAYSPMSTQGSYFINGIFTSAYSGSVHPDYLHKMAKVIFWFQDFQKKWVRKDIVNDVE